MTEILHFSLRLIVRFIHVLGPKHPRALGSAGEIVVIWVFFIERRD